MRLSATILLVACCASSLMGCCGRHHRHGCWFSRHHRNECVDKNEWDECDDYDYDDDDRHQQCGCDMCDGGGGYMMQGGMPMQSFDSGCGCGGGGGMSMPYFDGGMSMPMSMPSSGCGCSSGGGAMMSSPYPTFENPIMMNTPTPDPTPTPALAPPASSATESYYSPTRGTPTAAVPQRF